MINKDRILILNYLNAAYRLAFCEEAIQTQTYLSQVISFLRYYLNDDVKIVRLEQELKYLQEFLEIYNATTGRTIGLTIDLGNEIAEVDLPANTLILILEQLLAGIEERGEETEQIILRGYLENEHFIGIFDNRFNGDGRQFLTALAPLIEKLQFLYDDLSEPVFFNRENQKIELCLRLPLMDGRNE